MTSRVLVTGAAGFIGAHLAARLASEGHRVTGCDNFNSYYTPRLKRDRVAALLAPAGVSCHELDLADGPALQALFADGRFDVVVNLAAQAGVRHSARAPLEFVHSNLLGFSQLMEACRQHGVGHFVYASSSSVYGARERTPFREDERCDAPASFYAATKAANELLARAYAVQHGLAVTGVRLFTVYGPWGRPDMATFDFARRIRCGAPIPLFGEGLLQRDFTYVDDAVAALARLVQLPPATPPPVAHSVFNVGHRHPVRTLDFVHTLAQAVGQPASIEFKPTPPSEVPITCADDTRLISHIGAWPSTPLASGLAAFVQWLREWEPDVGGQPPALESLPR